MKSTMGERRLSALALMHIKYDMPVNVDEIAAWCMTINRSNSYQNLTGRGMYIELSCLSGNNYAVEMMYIA